MDHPARTFWIIGGLNITTWGKTGPQLLGRAVTNEFIPGVFLPPGASGLLAGGVVAEEIGAITFFRLVTSGAILRGAVLAGVQFTVLESLAIAGTVAFASFALTGIAFEVGIVVGSVIKVGLDDLTEFLVTQCGDLLDSIPEPSVLGPSF